MYWDSYVRTRSVLTVSFNKRVLYYPQIHDAFLYHSAPRPEVLKHPSSTVIAFFAVLKHPPSAVIAFYKGRSIGDTISARGYVAGYLNTLDHTAEWLSEAARWLNG